MSISTARATRRACAPVLFTMMLAMAAVAMVTAPAPAAQAAYPQPHFQWSYNGRIPGYQCVRWYEAAEPAAHTWGDNYLCHTGGYDIRWSSNGPISGMRCTQIREAADPHTWHDNYLCVRRDAALSFQWSSSGRIPGKSCIRINEPSDPHTWHDNYLCPSVLRATERPKSNGLDVQLSSSYPAVRQRMNRTR